MPRTQGTYITSVRERLDEPTERFWTDIELRRWINEAARDIARRTETLQEVDPVTIVAGTQQYTLAADILRVHRAEFKATGDNNVYPMEYMDYQAMDSLWFTSKTITPGNPRVFTLWGFTPNQNMLLYPTPSRAGVMSIYGFRLPIERATATNADAAAIIELPEGWEDLVVEYVLYQAWLKDGNPNWQAAKQLYDEKLDAMYQMTRRWSDQAGMITSDTGLSMVPRWLYDFDYMG